MKTKIGVICITCIIAILNLLAWLVPEFGNLYVEKVFPIWVNTYGRFSGMFPFSLGELMLGIGVMLTVILIGSFAIRIVMKLRKKETLKKFTVKYRKVYGAIFLVVCLIMTLNCTILYHCSSFSKRYLKKEEKYNLEELTLLRDYIVTNANQLALEMERDENGLIIYSEDLEQQARTEMERMGLTYPMLSGYYPTPKGLTTSGFFSQQYMEGYYFPFSMEANYNTKMYVTNIPVTLCHELSHLKGIIYEDEANLIGYLACVESEDKLFQYSGYLSVLTYVDKDFKKALGNDNELYMQHPAISGTVNADKVFLTKQAWDEVEKKAVLKTETVKKASRTFLETNLKANGVNQGLVNYSEVVGRLLEYYDGKLYK